MLYIVDMVNREMKIINDSKKTPTKQLTQKNCINAMEITNTGMSLQTELIKQVMSSSFIKKRDAMLNQFYLQQQQFKDYDPQFTQKLIAFSKNLE